METIFYQTSPKIEENQRLQAGDVAYKKVSKNDPILTDNISRLRVVSSENTPNFNLGGFLKELQRFTSSG